MVSASGQAAIGDEAGRHRQPDRVDLAGEALQHRARHLAADDGVRIDQQLDHAAAPGHGCGAEALGHDDDGLDLAGLERRARSLGVGVALDGDDAIGLHGADGTLLERRRDLSTVEVDVAPVGVEVLVETAEDHREERRQHEGRDHADEQGGAIADLLAQVLERDVEGRAHVTLA